MKKQPSEGELEILQILWEIQPASVKAVHEQVSRTKETGYTTTLKQMQRMVEKGLINKTDSRGKLQVYEATISEKATRKSLLNNMINKAFQGSTASLIMHALGSEKTTPEELEKIKALIKEHENKNP